MAIRTKIQPFLFYRDIVIAVLCAVFGVWGWYDYSVSIPRREAAFAEYTDLVTKRDGYEKQALVAALSTTDQEELTAIKSRLAKDYLEAPVPVPSYDRMLQFWVYFVGCGVLGTPWAIWSIISLRRRSFAITEDGTLVTPEGSCPVGEVRDIDMSRWMSKSIAVVTLANGTTSLLDDYKYRNVHRIVGAIAHRLYPADWTIEAKMVKKKASSGDASQPADESAPTP
jgi:hypothetical protein